MIGGYIIRTYYTIPKNRKCCSFFSYLPFLYSVQSQGTKYGCTTFRQRNMWRGIRIGNRQLFFKMKFICLVSWTRRKRSRDVFEIWIYRSAVFEQHPDVKRFDSNCRKQNAQNRNCYSKSSFHHRIVQKHENQKHKKRKMVAYKTEIKFIGDIPTLIWVLMYRILAWII